MFGVKYVKIKKQINIKVNTNIATVLLHLKLFTIRAYDINSPIMVAIKNEDISIAGIFLPKIPVYV